jgi:hypothetical protein
VILRAFTQCSHPISLPRDRSRAFPTSPFQGRGSSFIYALSRYCPCLARRLLFSRSQHGLHHLLRRLYRAELYCGQELEQDDCCCTAVDYTVGRLAFCAGTMVYAHFSSSSLAKSSSSDVGGLTFVNVAAVTTSKTFPAPSNDTHDYLSWAR